MNSEKLAEALEVLVKARRRAGNPFAPRPPEGIDYAAMQREYQADKTALTKAVNSGDPYAVVLACRDATRHWSAPRRSWPDDWSRWQRALDNAVFQIDMRPHCPLLLEDLL